MTAPARHATGPGTADDSLAELPESPESSASLEPSEPLEPRDPPEPLEPLATAYLDALLQGERERAVTLVTGAVEEGRDVRDVYESVLGPVQREIGTRWQHGRITVAVEHYCTAVTQLVMSQLHPHIFATPRNGLRLVATSARGNLHELGLRMVSDVFELEGWDTYYLGANTPDGAVVAAVGDTRADLLLVSATLPSHVTAVRDLVAALRDTDATRDVPVIVGGPPFVDTTAAEVGADAVAHQIADGLASARALVGSGR